MRIFIISIFILYSIDLISQSIINPSPQIIDGFFETLDLNSVGVADTNCYNGFLSLDYFINDSAWAKKNHKSYRSLSEDDSSWDSLIVTLNTDTNCSIFNSLDYKEQNVISTSSTTTSIASFSKLYSIKKNGVVYVELINQYGEFSSYLIFCLRRNCKWKVVDFELISVS